MARWNFVGGGGSIEGGILRKKKVVPRENLDELLIFGYACKLFRDDEKAQFVDQGKHLIPWMGDDKLKIDRYDGRGALSDLRSCEAGREGYDATRWLGLSDQERRLEQLCDEERYHALNTNEDEEALYKEEDSKRSKTNAFHFNYDDNNKPDGVDNDNSNSQDSIPTVEQDDRPYEPRPELDVPADINIPKTIKENARIEKTALFVSKQGLQMEILIKAKQADNAQFSFMNQTDALYKYYKHVLQAFKMGTYTLTDYGRNDGGIEDTSIPADATGGTQAPTSTNSGAGDVTAVGAEHYLHPSLASSSSTGAQSGNATDVLATAWDAAGSDAGAVVLSAAASTVSVPPAAEPSSTAATIAAAFAFRPSANCAYSQLINRIQGTNNQHLLLQQSTGATAQPPTTPTGEIESVVTSGMKDDGGEKAVGERMTDEQRQQYYQYYYSMHYYELYQQLAQHYANQGVDAQAMLQDETVLEQLRSQAAQAANVSYSQYLQQLQSAVAASSKPPTTAASTVSTNNSTADVIPTETTSQTVTVAAPKKTTNPLLTLAHYGSDTDNEDDGDNEDRVNGIGSCEPKEDFPIPSSDVTVIIDKMAHYVSKNGADFEQSVRARGDPRFDFLGANHQYHRYYKHRLAALLPPAKTQPITVHSNGRSADVKVKKKPLVPVSFSIKTRDEPQKKEMIKVPSALAMEESDSEEKSDESDPVQNKTPTADGSDGVVDDKDCANKVEQQDTSQVEEKLEREITTPVHEDHVKVVEEDKCDPITISSSRQGSKSPAKSKSKSKSPEPSKPVDSADKAAKTETSTAELDDPILEMIDLTKEDEAKANSKATDKALQLERRRKAAAFLKLKSSTAFVSESVDKSPKVTDVVPSTTVSPLRSRDVVEVIADDVTETKKNSPRLSRKSSPDEHVVTVEINDSESECDERERKHRHKHKKSSKKKRKRSRSRTRRKRSKSSSPATTASSSSSTRHKKSKKHHRKRSASRCRSPPAPAKSSRSTRSPTSRSRTPQSASRS